MIGISYELYLNNPEEHPEKKHLVDIYIPVKPL
ncbi:MAG: GyrI-like domain-containing protein [Eubacteriales bacterium]|jgi:AraC family transcriptional regulator